MRNPFTLLLEQALQIPNPETLRQTVENHPKYQEVMSLINQNGGNAQQMFYQKAQEMGVNANDFLRQLQQRLPR